MIAVDQIKLISELDSKTLDVIKKKSSDYAQDKDVLSNFKLVSSIIKLLEIDTTTPEGYCMLMVILKIVRICNLKSGNKTPLNESLIDSYEDLINYCKLCLLNEIEKDDICKSK